MPLQIWLVRSGNIVIEMLTPGCQIRRRGRPAHKRDPNDSPLRDGNRDRYAFDRPFDVNVEQPTNIVMTALIWPMKYRERDDIIHDMLITRHECDTKRQRPPA